MKLRNPVFHHPAIKHKFAESSLQYCPIKLIYEQNCFNIDMTDKVHRASIYSFKVFLNINRESLIHIYLQNCQYKTYAIINM